MTNQQEKRIQELRQDNKVSKVTISSDSYRSEISPDVDCEMCPAKDQIISDLQKRIKYL